jgi:proteasome lid subunit RPN8/RPN11
MTSCGRITFAETTFKEIQSHLLQGEQEEVALVFGHVVRGESLRLVVSRWTPVPPEALLTHENYRFAVDSSFLVRCVKEARSREESVVLAHSHPGDPNQPAFSLADDRGEADLYSFLRTRLPNRPHGALVVSPGGVSARLADERTSWSPIPVEVRVVGRRVSRHRPLDRVVRVVRKDRSDPYHVRQELLWGAHGQGLLRDTTIAVVGAGGTGSVVTQQLVHLGVGRIIVVDPQRVEASNLSRVVGARRDDVDRTAKVDVMARLASEVDPDIAVVPIFDTVCSQKTARTLLDADLIFLCTDGHYSRAVVNALALQHLIPVVDMGFWIGMSPNGDYVAAAVGEVRIVVPEGYCLSCAGVLDADRIMAEKATPEERQAHPGYFSNIAIPDPSVITVNSLIASLAVSVGLDMLIPTMRNVSPLDLYRINALKGLVRNERKIRDPACGMCGSEGILGLADDHPFPCA